MKKIFVALLDRFDELHRAIRESMDGMPPEALDWSPGPDMNSLTILIVHLAGSERYWIGDVVRGDPSFRDREAEFRTKGLSADALKQRLTDLEAYERIALGTLGLADLEEERTSPRDGKKCTAAWALSHALEHTAIHVGHIQILTQMWKQQHPSAPSN
jgi:hypothetical protein